MEFDNREKTFRLDDAVLMRIVQIVQEGLLTGVDVVDIMRLIELHEISVDYSAGCNVLDLTPAYVSRVKQEYDALVKHVESLKNGSQDQS